MLKFLNRGISSLFAIIFVFVLAIAVAAFTFWQYSEIRKEQENILTESSQQNNNSEKNQESAKLEYVPESALSSDDKIIDYLGGLYCGILSEGVSADGVYKKNLVAGKPDFFISVCSIGGECSKFTTMYIFSVDRKTGLISNVWWTNVYVWTGIFSPISSLPSALADSGQLDFSKSKINFQDLNGDGNFEIIQDINEMQCSGQCQKAAGCCQLEDYCTQNNITSQDQYQKKFKWQDDRERFLQFY
jgi:hypothetical protein